MQRVQLSPGGSELAGLAEGLSGVLGITGAPGVGKSTLAAGLGALTGCPVVPMDGFHLADLELVRRGLRDRKGAPETFDAWGYAALLERLAARPDQVVMAPGFERGLEQPLAGAIAVEPGWSLLVTEGNYLLLDDPSWVAVRRPLAAVWHVVTEDRLRRERLVARHVASGKSPKAAAAWVTRVDEPNAVLVAAAAERADLVVDLSRWSRPCA